MTYTKEDIERLLAGITRGRWVWSDLYPHEHGVRSRCLSTENHGLPVLRHSAQWSVTEGDAAFIAAAPAIVRQQADKLAEARAEVERLTTQHRGERYGLEARNVETMKSAKAAIEKHRINECYRDHYERVRAQLATHREALAQARLYVGLQLIPAHREAALATIDKALAAFQDTEGRG